MSDSCLSAVTLSEKCVTFAIVHDLPVAIWSQITKLDLYTRYDLLNKEQKKENGASPLAGPWTACAPVPDSKADVTTTEVWRIVEYVTPWLRFCCCSWNFLRVIFLVIDALLNMATEMAVDRLVHNSVQFVLSEPRSLLSMVILYVFLSSSLSENVDYFYRVRK